MILIAWCGFSLLASFTQSFLSATIKTQRDQKGGYWLDVIALAATGLTIGVLQYQLIQSPFLVPLFLRWFGDVFGWGMDSLGAAVVLQSPILIGVVLGYYSFDFLVNYLKREPAVAQAVSSVSVSSASGN